MGSLPTLKFAKKCCAISFSKFTPASGVSRDEEIDSVRTIASQLTDSQKIIAEFWAGGPGTVSPPLMFIWLWKEYIRSISSIDCPKMMWSLLDLTIHLFEGSRVTWRLKKLHMEKTERERRISDLKKEVKKTIYKNNSLRFYR